MCPGNQKWQKKGQEETLKEILYKIKFSFPLQTDPYSLPKAIENCAQISIHQYQGCSGSSENCFIGHVVVGLV